MRCDDGILTDDSSLLIFSKGKGEMNFKLLSKVLYLFSKINFCLCVFKNSGKLKGWTETSTENLGQKICVCACICAVLNLALPYI